MRNTRLNDSVWFLLTEHNKVVISLKNVFEHKKIVNTFLNFEKIVHTITFLKSTLYYYRVRFKNIYYSIFAPAYNNYVGIQIKPRFPHRIIILNRVIILYLLRHRARYYGLCR